MVFTRVKYMITFNKKNKVKVNNMESDESLKMG